MSVPSPAITGTLADGGPIEVLQDLELRRVTGELRFEHGAIEGSIQLFGGEIAVDQSSRDDGEDVIDVFLALSSGGWSIRAELPPLPVSRGTADERSGSLAVHVPVDLMSYCEQAGLTGVLELMHGERRAEAVYEAGELLAIELDGRDATDLQEVFAWEAGRFRIAMDPDAPARFHTDAEEIEEIEEPVVDGWSPAPEGKRDDTRQFLRVVEMALTDVLHESEKARSPTRTSPPLPQPPKKRKRHESIADAPPRRERKDSTVRLIYLSGDTAAFAEDDGSTRHVHVGTGQVKEKVLAEAQPERRASPTRRSMGNKRRNKRRAAARGKTGAAAKKAKPARKAPAKKAKATASRSAGAEKETKKEGAEPASPWAGLLGGAGWAFAAMLLGLVILTVLAKLPPIQ